MLFILLENFYFMVRLVIEGQIPDKTDMICDTEKRKECVNKEIDEAMDEAEDS